MKIRELNEELRKVLCENAGWQRREDDGFVSYMYTFENCTFNGQGLNSFDLEDGEPIQNGDKVNRLHIQSEDDFEEECSVCIQYNDGDGEMTHYDLGQTEMLNLLKKLNKVLSEKVPVSTLYTQILDEDVKTAGFAVKGTPKHVITQLKELARKYGENIAISELIKKLQK